MADIDINAGLAVKADVNKLYADVVGSYAKFKEDRRFDKKAYEEMLSKYAETIAETERIRDKLNSLVEDAQSKRLPNENDIKAIDAMADLMGAKKQDGSLDFQKLAELGAAFGNSK